MIHFEVVSKMGKKISTTKEYWEFIVTVKHPMMEGKEKAVQEAPSKNRTRYERVEMIKACIFITREKG